jgi:hypothetical protein
MTSGAASYLYALKKKILIPKSNLGISSVVLE